MACASRTALGSWICWGCTTHDTGEQPPSGCGLPHVTCTAAQLPTVTCHKQATQSMMLTDLHDFACLHIKCDDAFLLAAAHVVGGVTNCILHQQLCKGQILFFVRARALIWPARGKHTDVVRAASNKWHVPCRHLSCVAGSSSWPVTAVLMAACRSGLLTCTLLRLQLHEACVDMPAQADGLCLACMP